MSTIAPTQHVFHVAPWEWTLVCGIAKLILGGLAIALPLLGEWPIARTVGWLLVAGGAVELLLAWRGRQSLVGRLTFGSGTVTLIAGALLVKSSWSGLFPISQCVTIWLLLRGVVSLDVAVLSRRTPMGNWLWIMARGATDVFLGLLLLVGAPISMFIVVIFGTTNELVTVFFHILGVSFLMAGASLVAIALAQRTAHRSDPFLADG